ncbi:MAG: general secretion pathway protein GspB [Candidatus Omnitrophota bacterium]|jgi:hypothetical protein|nr:general secretion pathway protein GspB [Candidatus Omnitrophota bacterium]MDD5137209.1 general secretion pathway protein GspB [Candidatus Omnitrophota bacterium]MDD5538107.1 general secretion pathway protein GspB [Candidatus Omnitrophota bacterium]
MRHRRVFYGWAGICVLVVVVLAVSGHRVTAQDQKYAYTPQGRRDPFVPLVSPAGYLINLEEEEDAVIRLEGIMYDPKGDSMAIINGELLKVGEGINGVVVSKIEPNKIVVVKDNQKIEIELRREE